MSNLSNEIRNDVDTRSSSFVVSNISFISVLVIFFCLQSLFGLFDIVESRSNHAEDLSHHASSGTNFAIDPACDQSDSFGFKEGESCWHYPSRYFAQSLVIGLPILIHGGYIILKLYAVLLTMFEACLLSMIIARYFTRRSALISMIVYLSLPSVFYYSQMPGVHVSVLAVLIACYWSIPVLMNDEKGSLWSEIRCWVILFAAPFLNPVISFAWAAIGLAVFVSSPRSKKFRYTSMFLLFLIPVVAYLIHLQVNSFFGVDAGHMSNRLEQRMDLLAFFSVDYLLIFVDRFFWQLGPIGIGTIAVFLFYSKRLMVQSKEFLVILCALFSLGFFTLLILNTAFVGCCRYVVYPLCSLIPLGIAVIRPRISFSAFTIAIFSTSLLLGFSLHGLSTNYHDRTLQEFVHLNGLDNDSLSVVIDSNLAQHNGFVWILTNNHSVIKSSSSGEQMELILSDKNPDALILSNDLSSYRGVSDVLNTSGYCHELIPPHPSIPEHHIQGWLAERFPAHAWRKC